MQETVKKQLLQKTKNNSNYCSTILVNSFQAFAEAYAFLVFLGTYKGIVLSIPVKGVLYSLKTTGIGLFIVMLFKELQFSNAPSPISIIDLGKESDIKLVQLLKA